MKEERFFVDLDNYEHGIIIDALNEKKKDLQAEGKYTNAVDDLIVKVGFAPQKKFKVIERNRCRDDAR